MTKISLLNGIENVKYVKREYDHDVINNLYIDNNMMRAVILSDGNNDKLEKQFDHLCKLYKNSLRVLIISSSNYTKSISSIPESIGNLVNLECLSITYNYGLKCIPESIKNLHKLRKLYLNNNSIETLPKCVISELYNLESLNVNKNKINNLYELVEISHLLPKLISLNMDSEFEFVYSQMDSKFHRVNNKLKKSKSF